MSKLGLFKKGDKVRIKKGTTIYEGYGKQRVAGRDYVVSVHRDSKAWLVSAHIALNDRDYHGRLVQRGYDMDELRRIEREDYERFRDMMIELVPARVVWSGKNGWLEANVSDVEPVLE